MQAFVHEDSKSASFSCTSLELHSSFLVVVVRSYISMGSCLSKPSSKGQGKKAKQASLKEERDVVHVQKEEPWKASREAAELKETEAADPSICVVPTGHSSSLIQSDQQPLPAPLTEAAESQESNLPPASPSVQKSSSSSLSPYPATLPLPAQTPSRKKLSGEIPINSLRKPSSPGRALLHKAPSSPGGMKKSTSSQLRNEDDDCKFPSLARKQWLSQACLTKGRGEDETLTMGSRASAGENLSNDKTSSDVDILTITSRETVNPVSKDSGQQRSGKSKQELDAKSLVHTSKSLIAEAPTVTSKTADSRTNSLSRDLSPVELSRANRARPSSPLKRSPSTKDTTGPTADGPRLGRSSSGKVSSPNRGGLYASDRHETLKPRPLHKQSLSKEHITDPTELSAHKRSSSRDSTSEFSAEIIRRPSPPKKTPVVVPSSGSSSSLDSGRLNMRRPSTPSKENVSLHKPIMQEASSMVKGGKISAQRSLNTAVNESDNLITSNSRNARRKEKSPLRRTSNGVGSLQSSTRNNDRNADLSINSDTTAASHFDLMGKDMATRTRRPASRTPLKEITDNSSKLLSSKPGAKENSGAAPKARDILPIHKGDDSKEDLTKGYAALGKTDEKTLCDLSSNLDNYVKDPLEAKAENLVMGGKSVLSAFKALEEYRLKYPNLSSEPHQGGIEEDVWYSRPQPYPVDKENFSQPLQASVEMGRGLGKSSLEGAHELSRSRSTKKSCEQFFFPDVQSLLISENQGGMAMPASISKACSILRAVADLNMGNPMYPKKKEVQDEIERPNLLSFQFGEGDSDQVTLS